MMMYRVWDSKTRKWIKNDVYLNPYGELFLIKRSLLGWIKIPLMLSEDRYIYHRDIGLTDKNGIEIFEGDYIKAIVGKIDENDPNSEDKIEIGLVTYARELSSYIILCVGSNTFYTLGSDVCEHIEQIGNVFDGYEEFDKNGEQSL